MKQKIYRTALLILILSLLVSPETYAQQASARKTDTTGTQKDYQQQMKNLQQNMRDLQKQMIELRQQQAKDRMKQNVENLREFRFQKVDSLHKFVWVDSLHSLTRSLSNNIHANIGAIGGNNFLYYFGNGDAKSGTQPNIVEKTKTYSKSYPVNKNDKLIIDNRYGKVTVNTWNKNEFKVDVEIKAGTTNEAETQKMLDNVNIVSAQDRSGISFKTNIESPKNSNYSFLGITRVNINGRTVRTLSVNYTVFMPVKSALDITNRLGAIILPDLKGAVTIHSSNGNFTAKDLSNTANIINLKYADANIKALNGGDLNLEYGKLTIGTANNLTATTKLSPINIERLKSSGNIKVAYGPGLKISNLDKNLKNLDIDASYTNVSLDLNGSENFLFDTTIKNNHFNYNNNVVKILGQADSAKTNRYNPVKNYKGYVGKSSSDNKVTIKSNFSLVSFN